MVNHRKKKKKLKSFRILIFNLARTLKIFWKINPKIFLASFIMVIVLACIPFITSYFQGRMVNLIVEYLSNRDTVILRQIYILFSLNIFLGFVLSFSYKITDYLERISFLNWNLYMSYVVTGKLASLDIEVYENPQFNTKLNKVKDGYDYKAGNFAVTLFWLIHDVIQIIAAVGILITLNILLIPVILVTLIPQFIITMKSSASAWGIWDAKGEVNKKYWETRSALYNEDSVKETRLFGSQSYLLQLIKKLLGEFNNEQKKITLREAKYSTLASIFEYAVGGVIEFWILLKVLMKDSPFGLGDYNFYMNSITRFADASRNLLRNVNRLYENNLFMHDLYDILDMENKIKTQPHSEILDTTKIPSIEFKNVSFKYPGSDEYVFRNFSIKINPGEDIALVGENGAGKTTFVKLLARFYDIEEGEILINGIDIKNINLESWYKNLGILFQDFNRYSYTVEENIFLGDVSKPLDKIKVETAAKLAGAHEFISKFKKGYDQILSKWFNGGTDISGGQWQRIALARAFFRNSNILILDEPTSAIDAKGEFEIFQKISELQKEKTTIIISHRFSTVRNADRIYVIDKGEILESGSHEDLMKKSRGKYKEMFELQAKGYK